MVPTLMSESAIKITKENRCGKSFLDDYDQFLSA